MKKLLYTTSALVGAAFLMEAVAPASAEVNVSLRYRAALISQGKDDEDNRSLENGSTKHRSMALNSAKIDLGISGSKDHPNGLTTGATVGVVSADKKLDYNNAFGYISGSFGKLDVGDFHDVGYRTLGYGTPGTSNFGAVDAGFQPSGAYINTSATGNITGRASSLAYWSPSFSGAQIGISWTPQTNKEGKSASHTTSQGDVEDSIGFVASYSGSFGGTGVSMGVSYETAKTRSSKPKNYKASSVLESPAETSAALSDFDDHHTSTTLDDYVILHRDTVAILAQGLAGAVTQGAGNSADTDLEFATKKQDPVAYAGYISFDIQGFTIGGSYGSWEKANAAGSAMTVEGTAYALGASYSVDALTFGVGWADQTVDNTYHNVRVGTYTPGGATLDEIRKSKPGKLSLDSNIVAFTTSYQLGDGASVDFVIEQGTYEEAVHSLVRTGSSTGAYTFGKDEIKSTGFGVGIDLKF